METGGVEKTQILLLNNEWKILKNRGKESDGNQMNLNNQINTLISIGWTLDVFSVECSKSLPISIKQIQMIGTNSVPNFINDLLRKTQEITEF